MGLTWSNQMSVGNEAIDSEHKKILDLVNEVDVVIRKKESVLFSQALKTLEDATRIHFDNEQKFAQAINFPFDDHDLEHQYILGEFQVIKDELANLQGRWSESVAEHYFMFLSTWAVDHVIEDDMKMKSLLKTFPYDFKPENLKS